MAHFTEPSTVQQAWCGLAIAAIQLGQDAEADGAIQQLRALGESSDITGLWVKIADSYRDAKKYPQAVNFYQESLARPTTKENNVVEALGGLAIAQIYMKDNQAAMQSAVRLISEHSNYPNGIVKSLKIVRVFQQEHEKPLAEVLLDNILAAKPDPLNAWNDPRALRQLMYCYHYTSRYQESAQLCEKIVAAWPDYDNLAYVYLSLGLDYRNLRRKGAMDPAEADAKIEGAYRAVLELKTADYNARKRGFMSLAQFYKNAGRAVEAVEVMKRMVDAMPNASPIRIARRWLVQLKEQVPDPMKVEIDATLSKIPSETLQPFADSTTPGALVIDE